MSEWSSGEYQEYVKTGKTPDRITAKKKHKYNAQSCTCSLGHKHDSRGESACCDWLHDIIENGTIETQKTFRMAVNGRHVTGHRVDFFVTFTDGRQEVYEYKGFETAAWRIKHKLFEALYPDIPYIIIRARDLK